MSNPVFNRMEGQWANQSTAATAQATHPPVYDQKAFEEARRSYEAPSADAVDMGRMTYDDVIVKTALNLGVLIAAAAATWFVVASNFSLAMPFMMGGLLLGFVLAMVNIFSKTIRPGLILAYSLLEGVALGALSLVTEMWAPGVVLQAVVATFAVFGVTLALFASGKVRNSPKMQKFALISIIGLILSRVLIWVLGMMGAPIGGIDGPMIMGFPLSVVLSMFAVLIGAICLISDFDQVKVGVAQGAPAKYSWMCAFGMMVTLVWLYVEILNILSRLQSR